MSLEALYGFGSVALVSALSLVGVFVITLRASFVSRILLYLVSFATGAILGTVFLHLLPEVMEHSENPLVGSVLILAGMMLAFCIEKFIHWHHCHRTEHDDDHGHHTHPLGSLILIGDGIHNFIDGMLIVSAYLVSIPVGVATTIAVVLHEIPQELGDISLLLHSGFSRKSAILWNTVSACTALLGAAIAYFFEARVSGLEFYLLPIAAGNFLYIATTDLIPELHKETRLGKTLVQVALLALGMGMMAFIALNASHEDAEAAIEQKQDLAEQQQRLNNLSIQLVNPDGSVNDSVKVQVRAR